MSQSIRKRHAGVDARLLIKDAAKLHARSGAAPVSARRRKPRRAGLAHRLRHRRWRHRRSARCMQVSYFNDRVQAWLFNPNRLAPTYPESAVTRPFPFNAYYPEEDAPEVDKEDYKLEVGGLVDNKKSWTLDRALRAAAGDADHPPRLRRGLERDRQMDGSAVARISAPRRRRHAREICLVPLRRRLFHLDRHADRAASADADDLPVRRRDAAAQIRLPDEGPHPHQARLQEPKHVLLLAMLLVRATDGGPAFFRQERIGEGGRPFRLLKLRTMRTVAPGPAVTAAERRPDHPRRRLPAADLDRRAAAAVARAAGRR